MNIANFRTRVLLVNAVANGLYQVGFTQAGAAVNEIRVVHARTGVFGNGLRAGISHAVAFTLYQGFKRVARVQARLFCRMVYRWQFCGRGFDDGRRAWGNDLRAVFNDFGFAWTLQIALNDVLCGGDAASHIVVGFCFCCHGCAWGV